jgi:hypothetical protein
MTSPDFSMDYQALLNAARVLELAAGEYQRKIARLDEMRNKFDTNALIGLTGRQSGEVIDQFQGRLRALIQVSNTLRDGLLATVRDVQGDIDPGIQREVND